MLSWHVLKVIYLSGPHFIRESEMWIYVVGINRNGSGFFSPEKRSLEEKRIWVPSVRTPLYEFYTNDNI